jgi:hypothetical protein
VAISFNALTSGSFNSNETSFATASVSPGANRLVILSVAGSVNVGTQAAPTSVAGAGLTFTKVAEVLLSGAFVAVSVWRAMSASPSTGAITMTWAEAQTETQWSVVEFNGVVTTGTNGADAVVQSATNSTTAASTLTATLAAFASAANATYAAHAVENVADATIRTATPDTGWTEIHDLGTAGSGYAISIQTQYLLGNDTTAAVTWSATTSNLGSIAIEIAAATLSQPRFRWRNDDGSETTATWAAAENTNITSPLG